jgi:hypothetical protein
MALGDLLGEARGKVSGMRVLEDGKIEVSIQGTGKMLGSEIQDVVTFTSTMRTNGTAFGEGHNLIMGPDGMAEWHGSGVGKQDQFGGWKYAYGGVYTKVSSEKWARLLDVYTVGEYEDDGKGNYHWTVWEWK